MSWYLIVLLVVFYIAVWIITTIALTWLAKNSNTEWLIIGMLWPFVLVCIPFIAVIGLVDKIADKYGYKEEGK